MTAMRSAIGERRRADRRPDSRDEPCPPGRDHPGDHGSRRRRGSADLRRTMEASTEPRTDPPESGNGTNVGHIEEIQGVVIEAVVPGRAARDQPRARRSSGPRRPRRRSRRASLGHEQARLRGPAAPRRRPRPRGRHGHAPTGWRAAWRWSTPAARSRCPVGETTLGRIFNLLGETIDQGDAGRGRGALADPPPRARRRGPHADDRDARDRHQGRRPARALRQGRQGRPVRRRRRRQDRAHPGADPQHRRGARAACRRSAAWASARARATTSGWR